MVDGAHRSHSHGRLRLSGLRGRRSARRHRLTHRLRLGNSRLTSMRRGDIGLGPSARESHAWGTGNWHAGVGQVRGNVGWGSQLVRGRLDGRGRKGMTLTAVQVGNV